jgi:DNA-binding protein HU-beta
LTRFCNSSIIDYSSWKMLLVPGLSELSDKLLRYAERTFARVFQFVQGLTEVKDIYDLTKLQTEFIEAQISAMTELVRDMSENTTKAGMGSLEVPTPSTQATVTLKQIAGTLAERHGMARKRMDEVLDGVVAVITKHLKEGDRVRIVGLGTLQVRNRTARIGRNPATGEQIVIKASKKIAFRASKELNEAVFDGQLGGD